ncbi:MAG: AmmeMemoRadiSam system protein B, partial [bacterium]|nr:AmmeMemoRadiSam system protein B [bacterium]
SVLGPNHHGSGKPISVYPSGEWILPNGKIEIDTEVVSALIKEAEILKPDASAHLQEHSIEVQIPFILTRSPKAKLVPISMYDYSKKSIKKLSEALFKIISKSQERILLVASSDMTHYEAPGFAREQDFKAIAKIEKLDLDGFLSVVEREEITMCGAGPVGVVMETSRLLGAKKGEVLIYTNSGETCSPGTEVVGYLGLVFK